MAIKVTIPMALRRYADDQVTIELDGENVGQVLDHLGRRFPALKTHLFTEEGQLRNFVNVYVNDENIRDQEDSRTPLKVGDEVIIVPSVAGG